MGIGGSLHTSHGWRGQFDRVERWYRRIDDLSRKRGSAEMEDTDLLFAFFQNCYHLRDWLLNTQAVAQNKLDDFFRDHVQMRVCQDICNGTKHYKFSEAKLVNQGGGKTKSIKAGWKVDPHFSIGREYVPENWPSDRSRKWYVVAGSEMYDLMPLADQCMSLWNDFLRQEHLLETIEDQSHEVR